MDELTIGDIVSNYGMNYLIFDASKEGLCMIALDWTMRGREPIWYVPTELLKPGNGTSGYEQIVQIWMDRPLKEILNSARPYYVNPNRNAALSDNR